MSSYLHRQALVTGPWPSMAFLSNVESTANQSSYSFNSVSFGAEHPNRRIFVVIGTRQTTNNPNVTGVTIGEVTANLVGSADANNQRLQIWQALVPTGANGTIAITLSASSDRCLIAAFRAVNLRSSTPVDTGSTTSSSADSLNDTLDVPAGGFVLAGGLYSGSASAAWSNISESSDAIAEIAMTSALSRYQQGGAVTPTVTWSGAASFVNFIAISLR